MIKWQKIHLELIHYLSVHVLGARWMMPSRISRLVEISNGPDTTKTFVAIIIQLWSAVGRCSDDFAFVSSGQVKKICHVKSRRVCRWCMFLQRPFAHRSFSMPRDTTGATSPEPWVLRWCTSFASKCGTRLTAPWQHGLLIRRTTVQRR